MNQTRLWLVMKEERMILERQLDVSATVNKEINYIAKTRSRAGFRVNPVMSSKTQTFLFDYSEH